MTYVDLLAAGYWYCEAIFIEFSLVPHFYLSERFISLFLFLVVQLMDVYASEYEIEMQPGI